MICGSEIAAESLKEKDANAGGNKRAASFPVYWLPVLLAPLKRSFSLHSSRRFISLEDLCLSK
jgi:hypothetical protein